jgi:hypothetical protein
MDAVEHSYYKMWAFIPGKSPRPRRRAPIVSVSKLDKYKTIVNNGQSTLRALLTMNGGATLAFLTFLGHLFEKGTPQKADTPLLLEALTYFVAGTFAAVLGYGLIFLANVFSYQGWHKTTNVMFCVTIAAAAVSLASFVYASSRAIAAFATVIPH